ncbi:MAG: exodeoxyribonuclease V subunit gamma [Proteobacteria bacterium]|nr:exodeoxyribonuclease V subunit gamma [Pseudomonadota bacterium]
MLHLNFGLDFEALADDLMTRLKAEWTDPFDPPAIIFPDLALEHWFKLKWMTKYGTLANLNTQFLDKFLFNALSGAPSPTEPRMKRLPGELMRNMILAWLQMPAGEGRQNWQTLSDEVTNYIQSNDILDETRLFDLANQMTRLFMEYENSRPGAFKTPEGLIQVWQNQDENSRFFTKAPAERENWQKTIYQKIFVGKDSVLACINQSIKQQNIQYLSVPQLYERCRTDTGNIHFKGAPQKPVFLFWHAGMGQFYRVALHEYSKDHEVHAYIQNPCMEFWEDVDHKLHFQHPLLPEGLPLEDRDEFGLDTPDNPLLAKWGRGGRDNIKLWCESANYDFDQHYKKLDYEYTSNTQINLPEDSTLHTIQNLIAKRAETPKQALAKDQSLTVTSAPSKIREVENLHTQICQLLKDNADGSRGANIRDILVVAPDINAYRTAIYQVFGAERTQAEENKLTKRNGDKVTEPALYIPFTILDGAARESLTARALDALLRITDSRSLSRLEFFELVRNTVVQNVRNIDPDEISAWEGWLTDMQVFRDRDIPNGDGSDKYKDWQTGIKRLLLARLTDCRVSDGEDILRPFADLESSDSDSLCRFIDAVESLEDLCSRRALYADGLTLKDLDEWFIPTLNSWISMKNAPRILSAENIIYTSVAESLEMLKNQYRAGIEKIPWKILAQTLREAAEGTDYTTGSLFVNGLTFMNFTANRILSTKHIFFMGMDAASFPGRDPANSLDLRTSELWPGDNQNAYKNRYAFLCQLMSTSESIHLSYVNKNLQKDEDFYPSSIINDLFAFCGDQDWHPEELPLDETRPIGDLFTARAFRSHAIYQSMSEGSEEEITFSDEISPDTRALPERVSLGKLKKYLNDPFQFRAGEILQTDDDDIDPEKIVYEPIDVDNIELLDSIKEVSNIIVMHADDELSEEKAEQEVERVTQLDDVKQASEAVLKQFMNQLRETGFRTAPIYEKLIIEKIMTGAQNVAIQLLTGHLAQADDDNAIDLIITQELPENGSHTWHLQGQAERHIWSEDTQTFDITSVMLGNNDDKCHRYLAAYVNALALALRKGNNCSDPEMPIHINLHICSTVGKILHRYFDITPKEAEDILKKIYHYAYVVQFAKAAPMKLIEDNISKTGEHIPQIKSFNALKEDLEKDHGAWRYFKKGKIFDLNTDIGYEAHDHSTFVTQWNAVKNQQLGLLQKLHPICCTLTDAQPAEASSNE